MIDMAFSKKLEQRGFNVLGATQKTGIPYTGVVDMQRAPDF
jgi:hypothetical protein